MRSFAVVFVAVVLGLGAGCSKKKSKTTPKTGAAPIKKGPRFQLTLVHKKGAKTLVCEVPPGGKLFTYDLNRDKKEQIDVWKVVRKDGSVACREEDLNFDGKRDLVVKYYKNGARREVWLDEDRDGRFDLIMHLRPDGTLNRVEVDTNGDGKIDLWKRYRLNKNGENVPYSIAMDRDYDGYRDYWERYDESGHIDEISWTDEGATDEKPKYWLSNPQEAGTQQEPTKEPKEESGKGTEKKSGASEGK